MNTVSSFLPAHPKDASAYETMRKVNVNDKIEKKNGLSYLSWAFAVDTLLQHDPDAHWEYPEFKTYGETLMVFCSVTAFGRTRTAQLPVMDHRNKAIVNPNAFDVNTAMQRCLVKAIALHGLGLYIYAGEDLPEANPSADSGKIRDAVNTMPAGYEKWALDMEACADNGTAVLQEAWKKSPAEYRVYASAGKDWWPMVKARAAKANGAGNANH